MAITSTQIEHGTTTRIFNSVGDNAITTIIFCNTTLTDNCTVDVYVVGSGNVTSTATQVLKALELPATETFTMDTEKLILGNGDAIYARSSVDKIVCATVSSVSI